jgi:hypothetical protein
MTADYTSSFAIGKHYQRSITVPASASRLPVRQDP